MARRKRRGRYLRKRKNPGVTSAASDMLGLVKSAVPVAGAFIAARAATVVADKMSPGAGPIKSVGISFLVALAAWFSTEKVDFLRKHQTSVLAGAAINVIVTIYKSVAPVLAQRTGLGAYDPSNDWFYRATSGYAPSAEYSPTKPPPEKYGSASAQQSAEMDDILMVDTTPDESLGGFDSGWSH